MSNTSCLEDTIQRCIEARHRSLHIFPTIERISLLPGYALRNSHNLIGSETEIDIAAKPLRTQERDGAAAPSHHLWRNSLRLAAFRRAASAGIRTLLEPRKSASAAAPGEELFQD
ncbi:unnamed protein product [Leptosia nina]|uniref:Uncharacterized protein n=1 Tax=Leptosia nina TaxID=320188 RepID=A0AAV1JGT2_9NEOP